MESGSKSSQVAPPRRAEVGRRREPSGGGTTPPSLCDSSQARTRARTGRREGAPCNAPEAPAQPEIQQSTNPSIQPAPPTPQKRIRNGKIARLTFIERDMVNRMLRDNVPYAKIVGALD